MQNIMEEKQDLLMARRRKTHRMGPFSLSSHSVVAVGAATVAVAATFLTWPFRSSLNLGVLMSLVAIVAVVFKFN